MIMVSGDGRALLNLSAWVRRSSVLRSLYRHFPQAWRDRVSNLLSARASRKARFVRTEAWSCYASSGPAAVAPRSANHGEGVNILGYIRGQFGLAESARLYARALIESGMPVALVDLDLSLPHGWDDHTLDGFIGHAAPHGISIIIVNPDYLPQALAQVGEERLSGKYLIACWFWELERIPAPWLAAIEQVDEILVASKFIEDAFRRVTSKPILRVPLPLSHIDDSGLQRSDFGLDENTYIFLCTFDFNSWMERKNPFATIEAFRRAFPDRDTQVQLLVKSSNGHRHAEKFLDLLNAAAGDVRIIVRDDLIDRAHVHALQRCCDAYVSLHRAEGFGLGLAECMGMGKPVVATGWSGNMEFMTTSNSCLCGFELVPVLDGQYLHAAGAVWAEASIDDAARHMRRLATDPQYGRDLGQRAAADVAARLAPAVAAAALSSRFRAINAEAGAIPHTYIRQTQ